MDNDRTKSLTRAMRIIVAMDQRRAQGTLDERAQAELQQAEGAFDVISGRAALAAFRAWQAGGVKAFDPTPAPVRESDERSSRPGRYPTMDMQARR